MKYLDYIKHIEGDKYLVEWGKTTLKNYLDKNNPPTEEVEHILDYLNQAKKISRTSYEQAKKQADKWLKAQIKKGNVIVSSSNDHILEGKGKIYESDGNLYLKITGKANLNHSEHKKIDLPVGVYKVIRQIEFNGYDSVVVED